MPSPGPFPRRAVRPALLLAALCACTQGGSGSSPDLPVLPADDPTANRVGLGTWFLVDWDDSFAFADAMEHARPWQDGADWHQPVAGVDADGWPTADASTVVITGTSAQVNGTYHLAFEGQADVALLWANGSVTDQAYDAATNTTKALVTFQVDGAGSYGLVLRNTRRTASSAINTGFTHLRLYRPGYPADGSQVFTAPFLSALEKVEVIRMMDWTATNTNLVQHWSQRRRPGQMATPGPAYTGPGGLHFDSSDAGVALEHQVELCNALLRDCWINIPVAADDDYVRKVARALRYGTDGAEPYPGPRAHPAHPPLDPSLHVYLEYANEIWNSAGGFRSFPVIEDIVGQLPADHPLRTPAEPSVYNLMWRYPAFRIAAISDAFREAYGDASMMNRVRPLLMTQQGNGQATLEVALEWLSDFAHRQSPAREVSSYVFGAGGSGYYGANQWPMTTPGDPEEFFAAGNHPDAGAVLRMGVDAIWAANFGLRRVAYEGGPSLDGLTAQQADALNLDPRMQQVVVQAHDAWSASGGDLLVYYTLVGAPEWEFTPDLTDLSTPKLLALDQMRAEPRAPVGLGAALPGTIAAVLDPGRADDRIRTGYDYATTVGGQGCIGGNDAGEWVALTGHAASAFTGAITVTGEAEADTHLVVWVDGGQVGEVTLPGGSGPATSTAVPAAIPAGLVVIRLQARDGSFALCSIQAG